MEDHRIAFEQAPKHRSRTVLVAMICWLLALTMIVLTLVFQQYNFFCGILLFATLAIVIGIARFKESFRTNTGWSILGIGFSIALAVMVILFFAGIMSTDERVWNDLSSRSQISNQIKQIGLAMLAYHKHHGRLPPAIIRDKEGHPLYSWRVLLLPYLEEEDRFQQFHLNEPWNSQHNKGLLLSMPHCYRYYAPNDKNEDRSATCFQVFVGKGTAFEGSAGLVIPDDFSKGVANTILVVAAKRPVPWSKPEDLVYDPDGPLPDLISNTYTKSGFHVLGFSLVRDRITGFNMVFADGQVPYREAGPANEDDLRKAIVRR